LVFPLVSAYFADVITELDGSNDPSPAKKSSEVKAKEKFRVSGKAMPVQRAGCTVRGAKRMGIVCGAV
jgi:hypothetical protein